MYQKVMFGPVTKPENQKLPDLSAREALVMAPIIVLMFLMGLFPNPILERTEPSVRALLKRMHPAAIEKAVGGPRASRPVKLRRDTPAHGQSAAEKPRTSPEPKEATHGR
jgi:NADH-quinone oxidoreductase subunit M